ncbi:MAG: thioesterase [Acidobacteria bacterium]|nr:thioesterase [Acidobacteriota bacterium]
MTDPLPSNRWIAYRKAQPGAKARLFCFHYAGGAASVYRTWQASFPAGVEVCPVQLPGRESRLREPLMVSVSSLLDALVENLSPAMDLPFAFFGHSMGAILSFELALRLREVSSLRPVALFLSGRRSPHSADTERPIHDLPDAEFRSELRQLNGTPEEVLAHPELMELLEPVLRADFAVCETYKHQASPPLDCPITVFGGLEDSKTPRETLESWRRYTSGEFRLKLLPGDHFFLNGASRAALIGAVAADLRLALERRERAPA